MWLRDIASHATLSAPEIVDAPAVMLFDSCYAANMVTGRWQPNANVALVVWARKLLADVEATGRTVHWVHVKGHSADGGNDRADALVQWGKGDGPFARLREGGGEGDSRYGAADAAAGGATDVALTDEERVVARDALLAAADATARTGWRAAADAAYMGFTLDSLTHSIFLESKESVCSNGVLLERQ